MQPHGTVAILFYQQLVELLLRFPGVGQQDGGIGDGLLHAAGTDIGHAYSCEDGLTNRYAKAE